MENENVKLRVLVVESDENPGDDTTRILRSMDLEPVLAASHFQALSMLEDEFFPLLIVSAEGSGLDGMEFCRIFRKRQFDSGDDLPYIIIAGDEWHRLSICESEVVADDFIIRPWLSCELKWRVKAGFHAIS
ncbi:MAG: two-component system response regulator, partial [Desulfonatronovibrio sp.]